MRTNLKAIAPAFAALVLGACAVIPAGVREDGYARLSEPTRAGPLIVRPVRLVEDSRCPMNARCIWAGRVVVEANVTENGQTQTRNLVLGEPALTVSGQVTLDSVEPSTQTDKPILPGEYSFHFGYQAR